MFFTVYSKTVYSLKRFDTQPSNDTHTYLLYFLSSLIILCLEEVSYIVKE